MHGGVITCHISVKITQQALLFGYTTKEHFSLPPQIPSSQLCLIFSSALNSVQLECNIITVSPRYCMCTTWIFAVWAGLSLAGVRTRLQFNTGLLSIILPAIPWLLTRPGFYSDQATIQINTVAPFSHNTINDKNLYTM